MIQMKPLSEQTTPIVQRQVEEVSGGTSKVTLSIASSIQSLGGSGKPLPEYVREPMESAFGTDFSKVRVHANSESGRLNQVLNARAFTMGHNIFLRPGEYNLGNKQGQKLVAHELVHVVQQSKAGLQTQLIQLTPTSDFRTALTLGEEEPSVIRDRLINIINSANFRELGEARILWEVIRESYECWGEEDPGMFSFPSETMFDRLYELPRNFRVDLATHLQERIWQLEEEEWMEPQHETVMPQLMASFRIVLAPGPGYIHVRLVANISSIRVEDLEDAEGLLQRLYSPEDTLRIRYYRRLPPNYRADVERRLEERIESLRAEWRQRFAGTAEGRRVSPVEREPLPQPTATVSHRPIIATQTPTRRELGLVGEETERAAEEVTVLPSPGAVVGTGATIAGDPFSLPEAAEADQQWRNLWAQVEPDLESELARYATIAGAGALHGINRIVGHMDMQSQWMGVILPATLSIVFAGALMGPPLGGIIAVTIVASVLSSVINATIQHQKDTIRELRDDLTSQVEERVRNIFLDETYLESQGIVRRTQPMAYRRYLELERQADNDINRLEADFREYIDGLITPDQSVFTSFSNAVFDTYWGVFHPGPQLSPTTLRPIPEQELRFLREARRRSWR